MANVSLLASKAIAGWHTLIVSNHPLVCLAPKTHDQPLRKPSPAVAYADYTFATSAWSARTKAQVE